MSVYLHSIVAETIDCKNLFRISSGMFGRSAGGDFFYTLVRGYLAMPRMPTVDTEDWLDLHDLASLADPSYKLSECEFFLDLATQENDKDKFRWLISAFFGAAYSFFEINALRAYQSFCNPETGEPIENEEALETLRRYVRVLQDAKRPTYVKTAGQHEITIELYDLRKRNNHHYPISIMTSGQRVPEDFHFGNLSGKGIPALAFCRQIMSLNPVARQTCRWVHGRNHSLNCRRYRCACRRVHPSAPRIYWRLFGGQHA